MSDNHLVLDELHGPANAAQRRGREQARRNWDWLQAHWCELLPNAHGKFVAVADEQAFIADSLDAALAWIRAEHPDDDGHIVEYVLPQSGPRIYLVVPC